MDHRKIACKIRDKKVIKPFRDRGTEIVAFRGAICNRNGCPLFHWIIEMLYAKKVPYSRDEKVISLDKVISFYILLQKTDGRILRLIEVLYTIKRCVLWLIGCKKIMVLSQMMRKYYASRAIFETNRQT